MKGPEPGGPPGSKGVWYPKPQTKPDQNGTFLLCGDYHLPPGCFELLGCQMLSPIDKCPALSRQSS